MTTDPSRARPQSDMPGPRTPSPWILRFAPLVPAGAAVLDLASGSGRHARLFLARGHPVTAVDRDLSGLGDIAGQPRLELVQADLEDGSPWPLPGQRFGAVVVVNYLWRPLFPQILESVEENGVLLYETFAVGNEAYGRPDNPDFLLRPGELIELIQQRLQIVAYEHGYLDQPRPAIKQRICAVRADRPVPLGVARSSAVGAESITTVFENGRQGRQPPLPDLPSG